MKNPLSTVPNSNADTAPWEYDERRLEREANLNPGPSAKLTIGGLTELNFSKIAETSGKTLDYLGGLAQEGLKYGADAGIDLLRQVTGLGQEKADIVQQAEQTARNAQENPNSTGGAATVSPDHETNILKLESVRNFLETLRKAQSEVNQTATMRESLRIVGRVITGEDTQEAGLNTNREDLLKTATLHIVARRESQVAEKIKEQEDQVSIPSPAKQPSALEGAFEGRSGNQGGGTANLSAQATG